MTISNGVNINVLYLENIKVLVHIEVRIAGAEKKCSVFCTLADICRNSPSQKHCGFFLGYILDITFDYSYLILCGQDLLVWGSMTVQDKEKCSLIEFVFNVMWCNHQGQSKINNILTPSFLTFYN